MALAVRQLFNRRDVSGSNIPAAGVIVLAHTHTQIGAPPTFSRVAMPSLYLCEF